jgi:hypothetical protein
MQDSWSSSPQTGEEVCHIDSIASCNNCHIWVHGAINNHSWGKHVWCLVITRRRVQEEGHMGIVTNQSAVMVDVSYTHLCGEVITKRKRPSSLVLLEAGLMVTQQFPDTFTGVGSMPAFRSLKKRWELIDCCQHFAR